MATRNISISTTFDCSIPIFDQIALIQKHGFSHLSICMQYEHSGILQSGRLHHLAVRLTESDLRVDTIHGVNLDRPDAIETTRKLVEAALKLDAPIIVLHCSAFTFAPAQYPERHRDISAKIRILTSLSKSSGIRFALENVLPGVATDLVRNIVLESDSEYIGFCYDSSHDQINGPKPFSLLESLKERVFAVHLSDRAREFIDHLIPGEGFIDFEGLANVLKTSSFLAPLLFEVMTEHSQYKEPDLFLDTAYRKAVEIYDRIR